MYGFDNFESIIGKSVKSVRMDSDYAILLFTDGSYQTFEVEGDCCSYSYFTDFVGVANLIAGAPIGAVTKVDPGIEAAHRPDEDNDECIQVYGYKFLLTDGSSATLVFRNSSNGYYGGWMELTEAYVDSLEDCYTDIHI